MPSYLDPLLSASPKARAAVEAARKRNAELDAIDRGRAGAAPGDCGTGVHLRTAMSAIAAGIQGEDWGCVAEGLAMLDEIHDRLGAGAPAHDGPRRTK